MDSPNKLNGVSYRDKNLRRSLNDLKSGIDYLEPKYFLPQGVPDQIRMLDFLKACERLEIPREKWPDVGSLVLPGASEPLPGTAPSDSPTMGIAIEPLVFTLPAFDLCAHDHRTWKKKANEAWRKFRQEQFGPYLKTCTKHQRLAARSGALVRRKTLRLGGVKRQAIPLERRYELAARRYCLGETWAALQKHYEGAYRLDQVRKMVTEILSALRLAPGR